jgi:hypothetical protein
MSSSSETTQAPATTQALVQNNNSSLEFMTGKAHIYINRKKGVTETYPINKEMIYNIDITRQKNLKKIYDINTSITKDTSSNTMINMNPVKKNYPSYIYFDINNELNQSFSGSFYVSFDTELFESGDIIPICKLEVNKNAIPNSKDIIFYLTKVENKYYINVDGSNNDNVIISNLFSNENKTLSFLVLYNYKENILNIGLNGQDEIFTIETGGIIVKSLIFGNKLSDDVKIFNTTIKNNIIYNCFIGGIRFYNELNSFSQLRNSAFFKSKPEQPEQPGQPEQSEQSEQSEQLEQKIITTTTKPPINNVPIIKIPQYKSNESFTNYSPSAELFKNIHY